MAVVANSENAISVRNINAVGNGSSIKRSALQTKQSLSSGMPTNNESNKALRSSSSANRLSHFKKRISSLGNMRNESYHKIDSNTESFNRSWHGDDAATNRMDSLTKSNPPSRRGVRRQRSFDDKMKSLYNAAVAMAMKESKLVGNPQSADELQVQESNKLLNHSVTSTPRTPGSTRRRPKRLIPNETLIQHSNEGQNNEERRRDLFRIDFPGEPIPSDAILVRLYSNSNVPPPPPLQNRPSLPILCPEDLPHNSEGMTDMSFTSETEWKAFSGSSDRSTRSPKSRSKRDESSKSKASTASSRRSSSSKPIDSTSDHSCSRSHRVRGHKNRHGSKSKADASGAVDESHNTKINRRRDGLKNSSHRDGLLSPKSTTSTKKVETMKIRSKTGPRTSSSSDYGAFEALLNLSNGSFFDSCDEFSNHKTGEPSLFRESSTHSAPKMYSSFNDSGTSFASFGEGSEKTDKEQKKKKRKGKRSDKETKVRSRSADENRTVSAKSRRGKRGSKTKMPKMDPKLDDNKNSIPASWFEESESTLFDSSLRGLHLSSKSERGSVRGGKQYVSPKLLTRKVSCPENGSKQSKHSKSKRSCSLKSHTQASQSSEERDPSLEQGSTNSGSVKQSVSKSVTKRTSVEGDVATAKDILASPRIEVKSVGKTRWEAEPSPMTKAKPIPVANKPILQSSPRPSPPRSPKKLDFPLNFVEYQDVSPLTVASKKVEVDVELITAMKYLEG